MDVEACAAGEVLRVAVGVFVAGGIEGQGGTQGPARLEEIVGGTALQEDAQGRSGQGAAQASAGAQHHLGCAGGGVERLGGKGCRQGGGEGKGGQRGDGPKTGGEFHGCGFCCVECSEAFQCFKKAPFGLISK